MSLRLPEGSDLFAGRLVDRSKPIQFLLNGHTFSALSGDTVASALLANGVTGAGKQGGFSLGLGIAFGPDIFEWNAEAAMPLPPDMILARNGAEYQTAEPETGAARIGGLLQRFGRPMGSIGVDFDRRLFRTAPSAAEGAQTPASPDLFIVGGGIAGMSAAIAGAEAGLDVLLVERRQGLGGDALLFGNRDMEIPISDTQKSLETAIATHPRIAVATGYEVTHVADGVFHLRGARSAEKDALNLVAPRLCVIATGAADRLPMFSGNRLPRISGVSEAFRLARDFGVWPKGNVIIAGSTNASYRMALLAQEAGVPVARLFDARTNPQSRFLDFCKAYGLQMAFGTAVRAAAESGKGLTLTTAPTWAEGADLDQQVSCGHLITAGGWAPRVRLWVQAGGKVVWREREARLVATGSVDRVVLAGSAADYQTHSACIASGQSAVSRLLGGRNTKIDDRRLPDEYESPDMMIPAYRADEGTAPAYLSRGYSLIVAAPKLGKSRSRRIPNLGLAGAPDFFGKSILEVEDIEALLALGELMPATAQTVIKERGLPPVRVSAKMPKPLERTAPVDEIPIYLSERFGKKPVTCLLQAEPGRRIEAGTLIQSSTDEADPLQAIGVVLNEGTGEVRALVRRAQYAAGRRAVLREGNRLVPAVLN